MAVQAPELAQWLGFVQAACRSNIQYHEMAKCLTHSAGAASPSRNRVTGPVQMKAGLIDKHRASSPMSCTYAVMRYSSSCAYAVIRCSLQLHLSTYQGEASPDRKDTM